MADYAQPDVLVTTDWVAEHVNDTASIRLVEANEDVLLYETGHIPNAVKIDWVQDLQDDTVRDFIGPDAFANLCEEKGISDDTTVVFYGDRNNWWACYAFWVFKLYGHDNAVIMDGGRKKWVDEGREMTKEKPDQKNSVARSRICPTFRKKVRCAVVISRAPGMSRGRRPSMRTARSSLAKSWKRSMSVGKASTAHLKRSPTAASASGRATRGSS